MKFELPKLGYSYDALEPYIDAKTMEIHHTKHHQAYIDKLNAVLEKYPDLGSMTIEELLKNLDTLKVEEADRTAIRNHGGGYLNHSLFWIIMDPSNQKNESLITDITATFGSLDDFKKQFTDIATKQFGSGWAWLVRDEQEKLQLYSTSNQDSPYLRGHTPLISLDVWEHAYYLKYQNRRPEYIENWWQVIKFI
ncbi:MAG: superoxide dismutase [Candidatus Yanofskybacteria bacterium RIFCSPHIGHO2_01_FULL_41_21]|uniref:Superoxide dismutase n=1 Tax=Candidatus Yanofskybacteria bacterium RIFCSPHIGHO2_01_FULL_41_21 TaxID=1802660 RepID=A0A1F8E9S2_9BACT|nr:MAG: superoxide dismutase [Candidatus Yanofskybacteria bacterium RIFCSPHIGHO2_01_FULL_41_21]